MKQLKESQTKVNENYIIQRCHELLKEAGVNSPPIDPKILASFCGVNEVTEEDIKEAGMLIPVNNDNFKILLRKCDCESRKRFTCCHEIVHTFMPDFQLKPQKRVDHETGQFNKKDMTEYLCDHGASELLMPSFLFDNKFLKLGFNTYSLLELSDEFQTSLEATALKMVKYDPEKYALIVWEETHKPSEMGQVLSQTLPGFEDNKPKIKLRIQLGFGFDGTFHIPKHKSLDEDKGIIQGSYNDGDQLDGKEVVDFGKESVNCHVHALPLSNTSCVLTLLEKKV